MSRHTISQAHGLPARFSLAGFSLVHWTLLPALLYLMAACSSEREPGVAPAEDWPVQGYVLTAFTFDLPGAGPTDCPAGLNRHERETLVKNLSSEERAIYQENPRAYLAEKIPLYFEDPAEDPCATPQTFADPGLHTIDGPLEIRRLNADGSLEAGRSRAPNACPGSDFYSGVATRPVENQFWRAVGCIGGFQPGGQIDDFGDINIRSGTRTILLEVRGPAGGEVEGEVEVGLFSSVDPIPTGATGELLPGATLEVLNDPRYHNVVSGHLADGVLVTEPFDLRLRLTGQRIDSEYLFRDARLRLELQPDGSVAGGLAGYYDLERLTHGFIRYQDETGRSSGGAAAETLGYSCPGLYHALHRLANGHPDTQTGECTSISTLFRLSAVPAFLLWPEEHAEPGRVVISR